MKKAVYFCQEQAWHDVYPVPLLDAVERRINVPRILLTRDNWREHTGLLREAEIIVSTWGGPILDEEFLAAAPNLKFYLYGAGSIKELMTDAAWDRGIRITTAAAANAVPVSEFVLSQIIFSLKHGWEYMKLSREGNSSVHWLNKPVPGMYGSSVGIVALGQIGRKTCELLKPFDVEVLACSIDASPEMEEELGIALVSMEEIFSTCDVVSIHLPFNEHTKGMIGKELFSLMKPGSTFINTARGAVVNQPELIEFLRGRPDVYACLDVTHPEPPEPGSPLLELPNMVLTPHLAGTMGKECARLGSYMVEELDRYLAGQPLKWEVVHEMADMLA